MPVLVRNALATTRRSRYQRRFTRFLAARGMPPVEIANRFADRPYEAWVAEFPSPITAACDVLAQSGDYTVAPVSHVGLFAWILFMLALAGAVAGAVVQAVKHLDQAQHVQQQQRCKANPVYCLKGRP